jgi:hypothetical protein
MNTDYFHFKVFNPTLSGRRELRQTNSPSTGVLNRAENLLQGTEMLPFVRA